MTIPDNRPTAPLPVLASSQKFHAIYQRKQ
ncbi:hypothetical protein EDC39_103219 [Geothermobacter ehrlichii]|uniref:Uncharacterized protein n=1 Tax=Geothermobacter ehrlichii TaxID=213224 RepID=A0A5D3WME5_9BACT|nr:hypothetical protein EDC39_103219 [Geothermobacter ehrlichii]